jgi:hypothetical protein
MKQCLTHVGKTLQSLAVSEGDPARIRELSVCCTLSMDAMYYNPKPPEYEAGVLTTQG